MGNTVVVFITHGTYSYSTNILVVKETLKPEAWASPRLARISSSWMCMYARLGGHTKGGWALESCWYGARMGGSKAS